RTDTVPSITVAAEQRAATLQETPWSRVHSFPIRYVLIAIAVAAFVLALARPVVPGDGGQEEAPPSVPRRYAAGVAMAALMCAVTSALLGGVGGPRRPPPGADGGLRMSPGGGGAGMARRGRA